MPLIITTPMSYVLLGKPIYTDEEKVLQNPQPISSSRLTANYVFVVG